MRRPRNPSPLRLRPLQAVARRRAIILGYHGVDDVPRREDLFLLQLSPERFRRELEAFRAAGFRFTTVSGLRSAIGPAGPPPGLAAVTFDDALRNNLTIAAPILRELGIPATLYVPTGWLAGTSPWLGSGGRGEIMTGEEIRQLHRDGWEIGAHTRTHADLSVLDEPACFDEISGSCDDIEALIGVRPQSLAYPYGRYGAPAIRAAERAGLTSAVTTGSGSWAPFELTRAMMGAADPFAISLLKLLDAYEPLLASPPLRLIRRLTKQLRARAQGGSPGH